MSNQIAVGDGIPLDEVVFGLREQWLETTGDARICIAILDGPVDLFHTCFAFAQLAQVETITSNVVSDDVASRHGTHIASVIFGQHGSPVPGIAPDCSGLIVPIYSQRTGDVLACSQLDLARAINQAVVHGAHIINISGGELAPGGEAEPLLAQAIRRCSESGTLIIAAAGNNGCACLHVPAAVPSVLAVGAMNKSGSALEFSNWGKAYQEQGVLAPGENILGAIPGGGVALKTGTSYATPIVSGIAALLMSAQLKRGEKPDAMKVRAAILSTAEPCDPQAVTDCQRLLAGRLNLTAARARLAGQIIGDLAAQEYSGQEESFAPAAFVSGNSFGCTTAAAGIQVGAQATTARKFPASPSTVVIATNINNQQTEKERHMPNQRQAFDDKMNPGGTTEAEVASAIANGVFAAEYPSHPVGPDLSALPQNGVGAGAVGLAAVLPSEVQAAECASCAAGKAAGPSLVYALGQIGYDFGTESRRDQFLQLTNINVFDPQQLLAHLEQDPASAASLIWTLSMDTTVVYAIIPFGPFADVAYERLREALNAQLKEGAERVSVPGYVKGSTKLLNGQEVPVLYPDIRGIFSWSTPLLISATLGKAPVEKKAAELHKRKIEGVQNFLERVYYEVRNLGITPQERAMNYAATNAFQLEFIFKDAVLKDMELDNIDVERSPICRPGADCWDVKLTFFNPAKRLEQARHVYRFTVDVSDVIPVTVGKVRHWNIF